MGCFGRSNGLAVGLLVRGSLVGRLLAFVVVCVPSLVATAQLKYAPSRTCDSLQWESTTVLPFWTSEIDVLGNDHVVLGGDELQIWKYQNGTLNQVSVLQSNTKIHSMDAGDGFIATAKQSNVFSLEVFAPQSVPAGQPWWTATAWNQRSLGATSSFTGSTDYRTPPQVVADGTTIVAANLRSAGVRFLRVHEVCGTQPSVCLNTLGYAYARRASYDDSLRMGTLGGDLVIQHENWHRRYPMQDVVSAATSSSTALLDYVSLPQPEYKGTGEGVGADENSAALVFLEHLPNGVTQLRVTRASEASVPQELARVDLSNVPQFNAGFLRDVVVSSGKVFLLERQGQLSGLSRLHVMRACW